MNWMNEVDQLSVGTISSSLSCCWSLPLSKLLIYRRGRSVCGDRGTRCPPEPDVGHLIDRTLPRTPRRTLWILPAVRVRGSRTLKTTPTSSSADILDPRSGSTHPRPAPATLLVPVPSPHRQWAVKAPCARRRRRGSG